MFVRLIKFIRSRSRPVRTREPISRARSEAFAKVKEAEDRGDTRDLGRALMVLRQATHDELRRAVSQ